MKLFDIAQKQRRIEDGGWVGDIPQLPGVRFKVKGIGNKEWRLLRHKLNNETRRSTPENEEAVTTELVLRTLLMDWSGFENPDGTELIYSRERAEQLLSDPDYSIVRDGVMYAATKIAAEPAEPPPEQVNADAA